MTSTGLGFVKQPGSFEKQRGGFAVGLVIGLLLGLVLALGVALYVTKVPVPFVNKVPQRTAEQDAAEVEKNKNWDPNAPLYGKNPAKAASAPAAAAAVVSAASAAASSSARNPAAILAGQPVVANKASAPAAGASQAGSTKPGADPFSYFVQAGAYSQQEEAEQQRARLAIIGFEAKLTEREQSGRTVYRVRVGPFDKKDDADTAKAKLTDSGVESALVRVQR
jgi:cell division protein FtsN